jgi:hypothetical protein
LIEVSSVVAAVAVVAGAVLLGLGWRRLRRVEETGYANAEAIERVEGKVDDLRAARSRPVCMLDSISKKE